MEEMTTGLCPKCGHTLQIPAELERFSCMYCGERLTKRQLLTQPEEASCSEEDCAVSFDHAVSRLGWCVQNFRGYQKKILRDAFFEAFETYETGCAPVIQELNSGVRPERQTELLDRAAEAMLDELSAGWEKKNDMEDEKVILAIFFVPMVRKLQLPVSEEFVSLLQKKWVERYPKSPFYLGDYESISGGFRKKFLGLCFITTAVCQELGKPDDCAELTAFRAFRDGYLAAQPDGEALIREYYNIAPGIVTCINTCSDRHASYERMKNTTLASNEDESMVVVCKSFDDAGDDVACVKAQEIRDWKEKHEKNYEPISDETLTFMSTDEIYNAIIADRLPERYAFEFSPWEEILSWNLAEPSVARYGLEHCLAGILWEMTFFGVDPAGVEKEREKLDAAIEEAKQASAEGKVLDKTFSFEDFAKEVLGDEYTEDWYPEEEQERDRRNMTISSYKYGVEFRLLLESIL